MRHPPDLFPIFVPRGKSKTKYKVGYIDASGRVVVEARFDEGTRFFEHFAAVAVGKLWGCIDQSGSLVFRPFLPGRFRFKDGIAVVYMGNGKSAAIDSAGKLVMEAPYELVTGFSNGLAAFLSKSNNGRGYGYINRLGKVAIAPTFDKADVFSEGLAAVRLRDLWGYVNSTGDMKIKPAFPGRRRLPEGKRVGMSAGRFVGGLATVWNGSACEFIDQQ